MKSESKPILWYGLAGVIAVLLCVMTFNMMNQMKTNAIVKGVPSSVEIVQGDDGSNPDAASMDESKSSASSEANASASDASSQASDPSAKPEDDGDIYHIEWGDTLSEISGEVGVSVDQLAHANEIDDVDLIYEGSSLYVPSHSSD